MPVSWRNPDGEGFNKRGYVAGLNVGKSKVKSLGDKVTFRPLTFRPYDAQVTTKIGTKGTK